MVLAIIVWSVTKRSLFTSKIYKELLQINKKNNKTKQTKNNLILKWAKDPDSTFFILGKGPEHYFILLLKWFQLWPLGDLAMIPVSLVKHQSGDFSFCFSFVLLIFWAFHPFWYYKVHQAYHVYSCPNPRVNKFFEESWLIILENTIKNQDLSCSLLLVHCFFWVHSIHKGNICMCTNMYVYVCMSVNFYT